MQLVDDILSDRKIERIEKIERLEAILAAAATTASPPMSLAAAASNSLAYASSLCLFQKFISRLLSLMSCSRSCLAFDPIVDFGVSSRNTSSTKSMTPVFLFGLAIQEIDADDVLLLRPRSLVERRCVDDDDDDDDGDDDGGDWRNAVVDVFDDGVGHFGRRLPDAVDGRHRHHQSVFLGRV